MKYYLIAGEISGDLHGSNLVKQLQKLDSQASFKGYGGDEMQNAGVLVERHISDLAFMGFFEVVTNLGKIKKYLKECKQSIVEYNPDAVILIDYGGFNMKIAKYCYKRKIPVHYYITPKVWAWNQKRALKLKRFTDYLYVILPFEVNFFKKFGAEAEYVGNPVLDAIKEYKAVHNTGETGNYIALLPGSRKQELLNVLPYFEDLALTKSDLNFRLATVDNLTHKLYESIEKLPNVKLHTGKSYDLLSGAKAAVVTSGTATLETAIWKVPQVVVYKTSTVSYLIAKNLIRVAYISLVNLVADKLVVKELIQKDLNLNNLQRELAEILNNKEHRSTIISEYNAIEKKLDVGGASENTANLIYRNTHKSKLTARNSQLKTNS